MTRELKGWHVAAMFCFGFGIIISVNLTLAFNAVATFPGLEVGNSYVASQQFEAKRTAQEALGWQATAAYDGATIEVRLTDAQLGPADVTKIDVTVGRTTHVAADVSPELVFDGTAWRAPMALDAGHWLVRLTAMSEDGTLFEHRIPLLVKG
ncbi:FixH family protein [uncultured Tateyamaria sp.]|uniref:FixH family protein n=1 Tax=Tateyamaria sp. 1078 TaxID=3417464 RepID=UPI00261CC6D1|nr:FixH family protein [uncultured Tateyamaria sp.]